MRVQGDPREVCALLRRSIPRVYYNEKFESIDQRIHCFSYFDSDSPTILP